MLGHCKETVKEPDVTFLEIIVRRIETENVQFFFFFWGGGGGGDKVTS